MSPRNNQPQAVNPGRGLIYQMAYSSLSKGDCIRYYNERAEPPQPEALNANLKRDDGAFFEIACPLLKHRDPGCAVIMNAPMPTEERLARLREGEQFKLKHYVDEFVVPVAGMEGYPKFTENDVLVLVTRPPLTDDLRRDRKVVLPSLCPLEQDLFARLRGIFRSLSRSIIELRDEYADLLPADRREMANLVFDIFRTGRIREYRVDGGTFRTVPEDSKWSVGYFIHLPRLSERFPVRTVISFGVRGYETLMWNRKVRMQKPEWLERPVLAMAEMKLPYSNGDVKSKFPVTTAVADSCPMNVLMEHWLDGGTATVRNRRAA